MRELSAARMAACSDVIGYLDAAWVRVCAAGTDATSDDARAVLRPRTVALVLAARMAVTKAMWAAKEDRRSFEEGGS